MKKKKTSAEWVLEHVKKNKQKDFLTADLVKAHLSCHENGCAHGGLNETSVQPNQKQTFCQCKETLINAALHSHKYIFPLQHGLSIFL